MLVLARRMNERILLPNIETAVQVVAIKPTLVRLGVEAPPDVVVLREEVWNQPRRGERPATGLSPAAPASVRHALRHRLNNITLGLAVLHRQLQGCLTPDAAAIFAKVADECRQLHEQLQAGWSQEVRIPAVPAPVGACAAP